MKKMIVKNAKHLTEQGFAESVLYVKDGKVSEAFDESDAEVIDASGKVLMAGVIDAHVHFRVPGAEHKEDWGTASLAALAGGVTSVLDMPNNRPSVTTVENLEAKRKIVFETAKVNPYLFFGASSNIEAMEQAQGIVGYKVYMGSSTGNLLVDKASMIQRVFEIAKQRDLPVVVHAENEARIQQRIQLFKGDHSPLAHTKVRDCECARIATDMALEIQAKVGNRLHIAHMSTKEELDLLRQVDDPRVSCEVTPHHLLFTAADMKDNFLKMNPPLREQRDIDALWEGLRDGNVDIVATDHAPHTKEEKMKQHAPSGIPGVQFVLPILLNAASQGRISYEDVPRLLCTGPSRIFRLEGKGSLELGMDADFTLLDLDFEQRVHSGMLHSKCGWSAYEGMNIKGFPVATFVAGEQRFEA